MRLNPGFIFGKRVYLPWRLNLLLRATALATFSTVLVTLRLWVTTREYPLLPVIPVHLGFPWDYLLLFLFLIPLSLIGMGYYSARLVGLVTALMAILFLLDQNRVVPYTIHFFFFFLCFGWHLCRPTSEKIAWVWFPLQFYTACMYFYAGIHKLNYNFIHSTGPVVLHILQLTQQIAPTYRTLLASTFMVMFECASGFLLFWPRYQKAAACYLLAMHGMILLVVGPLSIGYNQAIWPWNLFCPIVLVVAFLPLNDPPPLQHSLFSLFRMLWHHLNKNKEKLRWTLPCSATVILFGFLPFFYIFRLWPTDASFSLFNANTPFTFLYFEPEQIPQLPPRALSCLVHGDHFELFDWSIADTNAFPAREPSSILEVTRKFAAQLPGQKVHVKIIIWQRPWDKTPQIIQMDFPSKERLKN